MPHEPYTSFEQWADEKQELELEVRPTHQRPILSATPLF